MFKPLIAATAMAVMATTAFANMDGSIAKTLTLKDGSTVTLFKDGKMAMRDKLGRATQMKPGHVMETVDGQRIIMIGNEVARIENILATERAGN